MTSSRVAGSASSAAAPARGAAPSRLRRGSEIVLVAGSVLAVAAAFLPGWFPQVGVGLAVAAAVAACVLAWRELFHAERRHARASLQAAQRHGSQLREERERNAAVVDTLTDRVQAATVVVAGQEVTIAGLRHEVFELEGDRTTLRGQLVQRDQRIEALRGTVHRQEVEITSLTERLRADEDARESSDEAAEVRHMPRRVRNELEAVAGDSAVLDLRTLETAGLGAVLPNYEEDRRLA